LKIREITSSKNRDYGIFTQILTGRGIKKHRLTLMAGLKSVREVLRDYPEKCQAALTSGPGRVEVSLPPETTLYRIDGELFDKLDIYGTGPPLLVLKTDPLPRWLDSDRPTGCTLFIPFQDPSNVGAVIRAAAAFEVARVVILEEAANPFHHRSLRAAGSTVFRIPIFQGPSLKQLGETGEPLFTLDRQGQEVRGFKFPRAFGLAPGLEGPGLPDSLKRLPKLSVPINPAVESLNAAMAVGIVLYEWRRGERET